MLDWSARHALAAGAVSLVAASLAGAAHAGECARPTDPGGAQGYGYGSATVSNFGNDQVLVWYTTTGPHAVNAATTRPDRVPDDGAAIWPVFLSQRFGDDVIRQILEQEGTTAGASLVATDSVLQTLQSSLRSEYPLFSAWNAATGSRAGSGGYPDAHNYPLVSVAELEGTGAQPITSGLASFFFHANVEGTLRVSLATDAERNTGLLVPFEGGAARLDRVESLPADLSGEGIVVVSGVTTNKKDAPFMLSLTAPSSPSDGGGCAMSQSRRRPNAGSGSFASCLLLLGVHVSWQRRRRARRAGR